MSKHYKQFEKKFRTMVVSRETAMDEWGLPYDGCSEIKIVDDRLADHSRWFAHHVLVIEKDGKFYETSYDEGDDGVWDGEYEITFREVRPVQITTTMYEPVPLD